MTAIVLLLLFGFFSFLPECVFSIICLRNIDIILQINSPLSLRTLYHIYLMIFVLKGTPEQELYIAYRGG